MKPQGNHGDIVFVADKAGVSANCVSFYKYTKTLVRCNNKNRLKLKTLHVAKQKRII